MAVDSGGAPHVRLPEATCSARFGPLWTYSSGLSSGRGGSASLEDHEIAHSRGERGSVRSQFARTETLNGTPDERRRAMDVWFDVALRRFETGRVRHSWRSAFTSCTTLSSVGVGSSTRPTSPPRRHEAT